MTKTDTPDLPLDYATVISDWDFKQLLDVYKHSLSASDGLPPYAQARIINLLTLRLVRTQRKLCLWVSVETPGEWYLNEIKRLVKYRLPTAILPTDEIPKHYNQFRHDEYRLYPSNAKRPRLSYRNNTGDPELKGGLLSVLRTLARMNTAHTIEIASLTGYSKTHVRGLLKTLQAKKLIHWERIGKYDGWKITNTGLRAAQRSWNVPKGVHFAQYRKEFRYAGERHRRTARMWRAWLETAYQAEIWACWTEVPVQRGIPDALAWGCVGNREYLSWLEVDTGHSSKKVMRSRYGGRLKHIYNHNLEWNLPIIFCIMGPPWVVEYFPRCIPRLYPSIAMIGHDWRNFGILPAYIFGDWNDDLKITTNQRKNSSTGKLPFDPTQYPPKPKAVKPVKPRKPKSRKEPFSKWGEYDDWIRDYHEE
jgi:hypothetical protein